VLREFHQPVEIAIRNLWLNHPELRQVPPRLRFLRPERRPKAVHLPQRQRRGLYIQLPRLGQKRRIAKVAHRKQRRSSLASRWSQNWRIGSNKAIRIEV